MVFETMVEVAMLGMHRWLARGAGLMPSFSEKNVVAWGLIVRERYVFMYYGIVKKLLTQTLIPYGTVIQ